MTVNILPHNATVSDLVKLAEALKEAGGTIPREQALAALGNPVDGVNRLSAVARAIKKTDEKGQLARDIYEEAYGEKGTIQSVARGKTFYQHFPHTGSYEKEAFNPEDKDDVRLLVQRFGNTDKLSEMASSAENATRTLVENHKYVYGSIAPVVGCLCAYVKELGIMHITSPRSVTSVANEVITRMEEKRNK